MSKMTRSLSIALIGLFLSASTTYAQSGAISGGVRLMEKSDTSFVAAIIPLWEATFPVAGDYLGVTMNSELLWGITEFFHDGTFGVGLSLRPFGRVLSIHGTGSAGTFLLNHLSLTAGAGASLEIPVGDERSLMIGGEYFYRYVREAAGFIDGDKWYFSSEGIALWVGLRLGK